MSASFPSHPWERVGVDLFELHGKVYIVIVDYYSRWVEYRKLTSLTSEHLHNAKAREAVQRAKQQQQYNSRHRAKDLTPLQPGDNIWVRDQDCYGTVVEQAPQPRSYLVQTPKGVIRQNRSALVTTETRQQIQRDDPSPTSTTPDEAEDPPATPSQSTTPPSSPRPTTAQSPGVTRTRSERVVNPPSRLDL